MAGAISTSLKQLRASRISADSPIEWGISENGTQLGVDLGDKLRTTWDVAYRTTQAEFDTLEALFESNQSTSGSGNGTVTFTDQRDSTAYTVQFLGRPTSLWRGGPRKPLEVRVRLLEIS